MNKTININLGGFFFHIDEVAYQKLNRYLASISRSLSDDPQGKNEIIADIEARISELLSEKITDARQVVNAADIEDIITIMGQPEDYAEAEESYNEPAYSYKRNKASSKKLFRDGDDKFLGGVCSGIGHYFNIDVIWIRLAFIVLLFSGFSPLIYIILWILLPEATTTAEKLQMEGEPVNIDNIEKKIREEFHNVSENVSEFANQASDTFKKGADKINKSFSAKTKKNNGISDFVDTLGKIILAIFRVIGKFIGILIIFISAAVILSLIIGGFSVGSLEWLHVDGEFLNYPPFFYDATLPIWLLTLCVFLLIGIPFLILFILGLRILSSNVQKMNKPTRLTLSGVWIISLLVIIFTAIDFGSSHAVRGQSVEKQALNIVANDTLTLKMVNDDTLYYRQNIRRSTYREEVTINDEKMVYASNIKVDVRKSTSNESSIVIQKISRGRNKNKANLNTKKIKYKYQLEDHTIVLDAFFLSDYNNLWKEEVINITLYIPENVVIYFDDSTKNFLYHIDNTTDIYDQDMANHHFIMTERTLKCTDCVGSNDENDDDENKKVEAGDTENTTSASEITI
ncbi:PspC domain-containing protein [Polaribacter litorisediminis]|uniref:PspC domain-containing protein n=1 Tax=Polaribacter litorisediminis TaxID=1908341 RepID=UPI001CBCA870|nr:PspC domain-containing protein [Polaribacter litorisediminis]UAM99682.1 PspC domain-containing protein [Polaribacter litorisediminis]